MCYRALPAQSLLVSSPQNLIPYLTVSFENGDLFVTSYDSQDYGGSILTRFHRDYEECRLLGYENLVRTSQETHYVSATPLQCQLVNAV
jgi:hypothetical protein